MFRAERFRDQHCVGRIKPRGVSDYFAQMIVVRFSDHVLDDDGLPGVGVMQEEVGFERPNCNLRSIQLQVHSQCAAKCFRIVGQPWGEMPRLVRPCFANRHWLQFSDVPIQRHQPLSIPAD